MGESVVNLNASKQLDLERDDPPSEPVLKVALPVPLPGLFDYWPPEGIHPKILRPGLRIEVPFGRQRKIGLIIAVSATADLAPERLRKAYDLLDESPILGPQDLALLQWSSRYYHHPLGEVVGATLSHWLHRHPGVATAPEVLVRTEAAPAPAENLRAPKQEALRALLRTTPLGLRQDQLIRLGLRTQAQALVLRGEARWQADVAPTTWNETPVPPPHPLTPDQSKALETLQLRLNAFSVSVLFGITGSGKTEVYLRLTQWVLDQGQQVLILVPEINLTPQLEARFRARLAAPIQVLHSGLSDRQRAKAWHSFRRGEAAVLLGTRSATFVPAKQLGLLILDEEHDASFKQQEGFRFSARDVAIVRGRLINRPVLLGSATPSLETYHNMERGRYHRLNLSTRTGSARLPSLELVDLRGLWLDEGLSPRLIEAMRQTLQRQEQILLFVNRRGYAPVLSCHRCGWLAHCPDCDSRQVSHRQELKLKCHHCGREESLPTLCPACGGSDLLALGLGTERVELALERLFPEVPVDRFDRDTTRSRGALAQRLERVLEGRTRILIGTQMLAKGHDFPEVTLVGILDVDGGLFASDFRAGERLSQLVLQVAGRAGRAGRPGRVLLQTRHPGHPLLQGLVAGDYDRVLQTLLQERLQLGLPPHNHQALIRADALSAPEASRFLDERVVRPLGRTVPGVQILGPVPALMSRRNNRHRWQCLLQADQREALHAALAQVLARLRTPAPPRGIRWSLDVDPNDFS